jgi:hypothetical protein
VSALCKCTGEEEYWYCVEEEYWYCIEEECVEEEYYAEPTNHPCRCTHTPYHTIPFTLLYCIITLTHPMMVSRRSVDVTTPHKA